jgi:hypothetical protein
MVLVASLLDRLLLLFRLLDLVVVVGWVPVGVMTNVIGVKSIRLSLCFVVALS